MTAFGRLLASLVLVASTLLCPACDKVKSPTEPVNRVFEPTPTPALPASMSGVVTGYGGVWAGVTVECQGRSAITSGDGTYSLTGLMSGTTVVRVYMTANSNVDFPIELKPGLNTVNLLAY